MKLAIPVSQGRVAPLFDACSRILFLDLGAEGLGISREVDISGDDDLVRVRAVTSGRADVLICGAISRELAGMMEARRVRVLGFTAGEVGEVVEAFLAGRLSGSAFCMPGSRRQRRRGCAVGIGRRP